jgi:hypothetical protein
MSSQSKLMLFLVCAMLNSFSVNSQENQPINNISFDSTKYMIAPNYLYQSVIVVNSQTIFGRAIRSGVYLDYNFKDIHGIDLRTTRYDNTGAGVFYIARSGPPMNISDIEIENNIKLRLRYISRSQTAEIPNIIISSQDPSPGFCLGKVLEVGNFWFLREEKDKELFSPRVVVGGDAAFPAVLADQYRALHERNFQYIHNAAICLGTHSPTHPSMTMSNADMRSLRDTMLLISGMRPVTCRPDPAKQTREICEFTRSAGNR